MAMAAVVDSLKRRLIQAVKANDVDVAKRCIDDGASPDTICDNPRNGSSVLCLASYLGFAKMVSLLVERGANVEHRDTDYYSTPFLEAAFRGHVAVIGLLVELGCNRLARNKWNNGAVALACLNGQFEAVKFLVDDLHLAVNDKHQMGRTPLHDSASEGYPDVCEYLLERKAKLESLDENHSTPFLLAACFGHVNVMKLFIQWKCDTSARDKANNGALNLASLNGKLDAVKFLVDMLHMSVSDHHGKGRTPLHSSAEYGYPDVCEYLLQREAELESLDEEHYTPFLRAAHFGHVNVMKLLIQWKCDTSARNKFDNGALALSSMRGHLPVVEFLVHNGLKVNERHQDSKSALHFACAYNRVDIAEFLISKGADSSLRDETNRRPHEFAKGNLKNIVQFAHLYATGTVSLDCLKICLLGNERAGKTTLAKAIMRTWLSSWFSADENAADRNDVRERTAGMKIYRAFVSCLGNVILCDFAGQEYFARTHSLFFDELNSLNIVVVSGLLDRREMLKQCRRWASLLIAASPQGIRPILLLVVSRRDVCGGGVGVIVEEVIRELRATFTGELDIEERFFLLDCRKSQSPDMVELRKFLGSLKIEKLQTARKYPRLVRPVLEKLLPRLRKDPSSKMLKKTELTGLVKSDKAMPRVSDDSLEDTVDFLHASGEVFLLSYLALLDIPWMSHSLLGPVLAPPQFLVHLEAAVSREKEGTATKQEISTVIRAFQAQQGNNPDCINTDYAVDALETLGVMFELPDRAGVYCIPAHLPVWDRNEIWPHNPDKMAYVGRRVQCLRDIDIFTSAFFVFFQSRLAVMVDRNAFLWKGGIKAIQIFEEKTVECLVELTKDDRAVDLVARGSVQSRRHCLEFVEAVHDILVRLLETKSPGTQTCRYLLYPPDLVARVVEPFGFLEEKVEQAIRRGLPVVVRKNEATGQFVETTPVDLMASKERVVWSLSGGQTAENRLQLGSSVSDKETVSNDPAETFSSIRQEITVDEPSRERRGSPSASRKASADRQPTLSPLFTGALSDKHESDLPSSIPRLVKAVQKQGSSRWFALGIAMGYNISKMAVICKENTSDADKILVTFCKKEVEAGREAAIAVLKHACQEIEPPIYSAVQGELVQMGSHVDTAAQQSRPVPPRTSTTTSSLPKEEMTAKQTQSQFPSLLLRAVQKRASKRWFALALSMGFNEDEISSMCKEIPFCDRLLAIFLRKRQESGLEVAELALKIACKEIQPPIDEAVREELGRDL